jgi:hypothetical protein
VRIEVINNEAFLDLEAAAELCDVVPHTVRNWLDKANPPPVDRRHMRFPLRKFGDWIRREQIFKTGRGGGFQWMPDPGKLMQFMPPGTYSASPPEKLTKLDAETRLRTAQAEKVEIEIAELRRELVPARQVEIAMAEAFAIVKTRLLSVPSAVSPLVMVETDVHAVQRILEDAIEDALTELSRQWQDAPAPVEPDDEPDQ